MKKLRIKSQAPRKLGLLRRKKREKEYIAMPVIDPNEEANIPREDPRVEPEHYY